MSMFSVGDVVRVSTDRPTRWMFDGDTGVVQVITDDTAVVKINVPGREPEEVYFSKDELVPWTGLDLVLGMLP